MSKPISPPSSVLPPNPTYLNVNGVTQTEYTTKSKELLDTIEKVGNRIISNLTTEAIGKVDNLNRFGIYPPPQHRLSNPFQKEINPVLEKLNIHYLTHQKVGLQSAEIALMTQLSVELARLLLTDEGLINVDIIPYLIKTFVEDPKLPRNHEINLSYTLRMLLSSKNLRDKISKVTRPDSAIAPANIVIRSVLDLPENVIPTDLHAKQTAVAGLLSHLRQGSDGSCFASPIVIWLLSSHLEKCVDDFSSLLKSSKLTRKIQTISRDFPFLLRMSNKNMSAPITLSRLGEIKGDGITKGLICEAPGFIKACESLGIEDCHTIFPGIIKNLFKNELDDKIELTTTVRKILQELAKHASTLPKNVNKKAGTHFLTAYFAYEGQVNNALLAVWENSIAGMAEADESSMVTSVIIETTLTVLKEKLTELFPNNQEVVNRVIHLINIELFKRINLYYDPIVPHAGKNSSYQTTEGAFVLYDKGNYKRSSCWIRIDTPHSFTAFTSRLIEGALLNANQDEEMKKKFSLFGKEWDRLAQFIETDEYLIKILRQYYKKNSKITDPLKNYKEILYAPWITKSGNSFNKVLQVYLENYNQDETVVLDPLDAKDLCKKIILLGKEMPTDEQNKYIENSHLLIPARIPKTHAFSLMMGHPTIRDGWKSSLDAETWIEKQVISNGKVISETTITKTLREKLIKHFCEHFLNEKERESFLKKIKLLETGQSIREFRTSILQCLGRETTSKSPQIMQIVDTYIYQNLPRSLQAQLERSAIHFADSNWSEGLNDIHFCFLVNPGNGELEIWGGQDDNKNLIALDQKTWLKQWEIFR